MGPTISPETDAPKSDDVPATPVTPSSNAFPHVEPIHSPASVDPTPMPVEFSPPSDSDNHPGTYLPEYLVMLILLAVVVGAITSLFAIGIDSVIPAETASKTSAYGADFSSFQLTWSLAALLSALPLFVWLFLRTRKVESSTPAVRNHRWRRGFLAGFIVVEILSIVSSVNSLFFDLIGRAIGEDNSGIFSYFASGDKDPWWQSVIITVVSVTLLGFVVFVMARDYRKREV